MNKTHVLNALHGRELYTLQIPSAIVQEGGPSISVGRLYPILHKLELDGLIESYWSANAYESRGGARRRYYRLTQWGIHTLTHSPTTSLVLEGI